MGFEEEYCNEIIADASTYFNNYIEEFVTRDEDGKIVDYVDLDTLYDELWPTDDVCGNGPYGHGGIPHDIGNVFFTDLWKWIVQDFGVTFEDIYDNNSPLTPEGYVDATIRCWCLGECMNTIYKNFEETVQCMIEEGL